MLTEGMLRDELTDWGYPSLFAASPHTRLLFAGLVRPSDLATGDALWDDVTTPATETRDDIVLAAQLDEPAVPTMADRAASEVLGDQVEVFGGCLAERQFDFPKILVQGIVELLKQGPLHPLPDDQECDECRQDDDERIPGRQADAQRTFDQCSGEHAAFRHVEDHRSGGTGAPSGGLST